MIDDPLTALVVISSAAFACQWLAARLAVPSVLFLLAVGVALSGVLDPDALFGDLLFTGVGLGVAVLLFEGGSSLNWAKLTTGRQPVVRLVSVGALVAWAIGSGIVMAVLDVDTEIALLMGAILTVSGPTVVMPLLRVVRPREPTGSILRWEGILIDPVGASLAIVVLDAIIEDRSAGRILLRILSTFAAGLAVGAAIGILVVAALHRRLISDHLQVPATLAAVIASYGLANELRPEAGLIAVTILGMWFANQRRVPTGHIVEFNENLGASVLGLLFIVLGARVDVDELVEFLPESLAIVAVLVLVARPATVIASTLGTDVSWRDRGFLMVLAPRGVVAAAVASLFALELDHHGIDPGPIVPVIFSVVVGTVTIAGLTARFAAHRLRVAQAEPKGVALVGGGRFALELADQLGAIGVPTLHIGLSDEDADEAARRGQLVYGGRLDTEDFSTAVQSMGIAHALALSGTDHLDAYVTDRIAHIVGSGNVYGIDLGEDDGAATERTVTPKPILPDSFDVERLAYLFDNGVRVRTTPGPRHPRSGWVTICRVDDDHRVTFNSDPTTATEGQLLVQIGPGLHSESGEGR